MDWQATALGRVPWDELRARFPPGAVGVWADIDGFHVADPPVSLRGATHMWVAAPGVSWRLRVDGDSVIGARLERHPGDGDADASEVALQPRKTPDDELAAALRRATQLTALQVRASDADAWFLALPE